MEAFLINRYKSKFSTKVESLSSLFFILFIAFKPFYFWNSGLPQIAYIFFLVSIFIFLIEKKQFYFLNKNHLNSSLILGLLFFNVTFVNLINFLLTNQDVRFLLAIFYYLFNFLVFWFGPLIISQLTKKEKLFILTSLSLTLLLQIIFVFFPLNDYWRFTGTFNNPNQLSYFILLNLGLHYLFLFHLKSHYKLANYFITNFVASLILSVFLNLNTDSRAGLLALFPLFFLPIKFIPDHFQKHIPVTLLFLSLFTLSLIFIYFNQFSFLISSVYNSLSERGDFFQSIYSRGYYRFFLFGEYLFLGAGEGDFFRFNSIGIEFHSSFGNVFFNYGIIGILLYLLIHFQVIKNTLKTDYFQFLIFLSLILYGITHNGNRQPFFWLIFSMMISLAPNISSNRYK